jgi:DNA polymerase zeta
MIVKFVCVVVYGYLGAGWCGRMPCVEIADAVVQTGNETLERAIRLVEDEEVELLVEIGRIDDN